MKSVFLILVIQFFIAFCFSQELETSNQIIVKEDETAVLWCRFSDNKPFSECNWHLPRGETCEVGPSKNCAVEDTIKYIGDEKNCQIQIERVQQDEDGNWQCHLMDSYGKKSVGDISLVIANKALVDINPFGVAVVEAQDSMAISCTASKARPLGEFRWFLKMPPNNEEIQLSSNQPDKTTGDSTKQVLEFIPEPKYNEAKLYCAYEQFDESKNLLYAENDQHVQLSVTYVLDPYENMVNISQIRADTDVNITIQFGAHPQPPPENVVWVIKNVGRTIEIPTEKEEVVVENNYLVHPVMKLQENQYSATITIEKIQAGHTNLGHYLRVTNGRRPENTKEHKFSLAISENFNDDGEIATDSSSTATIIVISIVVLVLIGIISGALVFYSKKQEIWCFKPTDDDTVIPPSDVEVQRPLNQALEEEGGQTHIARPQLRRPTEI